LNPYYYFEHLLAEIPKLIDENGNIKTSKLDQLLPWADELPAKCHKPRRRKVAFLTRQADGCLTFTEIMGLVEKEKHAILVLKYIGEDAWSRPVYQDQFKHLWKDVDLG